ncbi:MAG: c-type cytochrome [Acidobacteria bacterium]|nr:c-type cytochrome [Acidobacteriota bacterium]
MGRDPRRLILLALLLAAPGWAGGAKPTIQEAIGWRLFFEPALSRPGNYSCATCHIPSKGFEGGEPLGRGAHGDPLGRNTPTVVNLADTDLLFWDGRASSLEEQASGPMTNPKEMDMTLDLVVERVRSLRRYREAFAKMGVEKPTVDDIAGAIAAFERRLTTGPTTFDRWIHGDRSALNEQQERGRLLFFTKGDCALCHNGANLSDGDFHNLGTGTPEDQGRYAIEKEDYYKGAFKTPALRNWKGREPFFHDGRFKTLRDVLEFYSNPPDSGVGEREIEPKAFSEQEIDDLIAFLETLNGDWPDLKPFEQAWKALGVE